MTDNAWSARDELDALWQEVRSLRGGRSLTERQGMLERLGAGNTPSRVSLAGLGAPEYGYPNQASAYQGNVLPLTGHPNLLTDPTFETLPFATDPVNFTTTPGTGGYWRAQYVLASGSPPSTATFNAGRERAIATDQRPFNSGTAAVSINATAAFSGDIYLYPATDLPHPLAGVLPYLVGACRVFTVEPQTATALTAALELYDATNNVVVATSEAWDMKAATPWVPYRLAVATQQSEAFFNARAWRWRLRLSLTLAAGASFATADAAEPQLHYAFTPDPLPFAPAIAYWYPAVRPARSAGLASAGSQIQTYRSSVIHPIFATGNVTLTSTPTLPPTVDGHEIVLLNTGAPTVTLQDAGTLAGSGLRLTASTITLGQRDSVRLVYLATSGWVQIGPVVAAL